jgi:hypothetical protein
MIILRRIPGKKTKNCHADKIATLLCFMHSNGEQKQAASRRGVGHGAANAGGGSALDWVFSHRRADSS